MTDIPNIPIQDPLYANGDEVMYGGMVHRYVGPLTRSEGHVIEDPAGHVLTVTLTNLSPLPPPLPKLRDGWYTVDSNGALRLTLDAMRGWELVDEDPGRFYVGVVFLEAATMRLWHVDRGGNRIDRDGTLGDPVEVTGDV